MPPHYLVKLKPLKSVITVRSIEPVVHNFRPMFVFANFLVETYFISFLAVKLPHSQVFFVKNVYSVIFKLNVFNFDN